ncbi:hypothetical protein J7E50_21460 [Pedobacter sp. ISL-68]|uniref:hypothetical protein n=1 Tax=unclassified Pedobacter TaxID=2628915 RepID=UPI001BE97817|nr:MULTISPECIES: hypothetical protein [unclassified Pedobacter]MBT2563793.1 hypothetical protein [Pedobacter sp. ISL-64]MBT2592801.1 hypothetical protein [Pedobacter sp. ISL-68]
MIKEFKENLDTAVFTSKYVMTNSSPIVYIAHHEDGAWEFWGDQTINESEIVVVSLQQIIKVDPTILEVSDLPIGFNAIRETKEKPWVLVSKN